MLCSDKYLKSKFGYCIICPCGGEWELCEHSESCEFDSDFCPIAILYSNLYSSFPLKHIHLYSL